MRMNSEPQTGAHEAEDLFAIAFNANPQPNSIITFQEGRILKINDAFLGIIGYRRAELIGKSAADLLWRSADERRKTTRLLRENRAAHDQEATLYTKTGDALVMWFSAVLIEFGDETCVLVAASDIRESEQRYRAIVDAAREGIWVIDAAAQSTYLNQRMAQMLGYTVEEMLGRSIYDFLDPADHQGAQGCFTALPEGGQAQHDYRFRHKGGATIWTICATSPMFNNPGQFTGALVMVSDITARKRAEQERDEVLAREKAARIEAEHISLLYAKLFDREQGARTEAETVRREWQTTFDTLADHVLLADREDRLVRANRAFYEEYDLTPEQAIGRPVAELVHAGKNNFVAASNCPICNLRRKAERAIIELPAGIITAYPVAVSIDPITDEAGNPTGIVQLIRDLTELYRAREEAERERASLNAAIEQMAEGLMVFDAQASVIRANRRARIMFGPPEHPHEIISNYAPASQFTDERGKPLAPENLPVQTALREQRIVEAHLWYTRLDDKRVFLAITASPLFNDQNQLVGAIALLRDITEQQREQERAAQADKLRALGQLASGVAHNFNNALAAVLGYTQLSIPKVKGSEVEKYLRVVEQSAKDAARMVERIQNFARARARTDDFLPICINDIVHDAIDITRPRWRHDAEALGVKYDVQIDWQTDEEILVNGEPSELREVFVNIIFNALDAMPMGGRLEIRGTADDQAVRLSFADTGSGMTEEIKRRIFEPFFTTKGVSGLGMGLSETYRIIERHGGHIDVDSQPRQGAAFTILLPVAGMPNYHSASALTSPAVRGVDMLVIDDEEHVRNVLAALLVEMGHRVTIAASAEEALRLIEQCEFSIVFTDLAMPKTDGIATANEIKARRPQTKIVLMSGYGAERAGERAAETSCIDATLNKPFRVFEIQNALRTLLP
jgi:PAS domain S-box-containing protein